MINIKTHMTRYMRKVETRPIQTDNNQKKAHERQKIKGIMFSLGNVIVIRLKS